MDRFDLDGSRPSRRRPPRPRRRDTAAASPPRRRSMSLLGAPERDVDGARDDWDRRAKQSQAVIGVSCPRCSRPLQAPGYWFERFCQCGEDWDILESTLDAHGLLGTSLRFVSSSDIDCG